MTDLLNLLLHLFGKWMMLKKEYFVNYLEEQIKNFLKQVKEDLEQI